MSILPLLWLMGSLNFYRFVLYILNLSVSMRVLNVSLVESMVTDMKFNVCQHFVFFILKEHCVVICYQFSGPHHFQRFIVYLLVPWMILTFYLDLGLTSIEFWPLSLLDWYVLKITVFYACNRIQFWYSEYAIFHLSAMQIRAKRRCDSIFSLNFLSILFVIFVSYWSKSFILLLEMFQWQ